MAAELGSPTGLAGQFGEMSGRLLDILSGGEENHKDPGHRGERRWQRRAVPRGDGVDEKRNSRYEGRETGDGETIEERRDNVERARDGRERERERD